MAELHVKELTDSRVQVRTRADDNLGFWGSYAPVRKIILN